MAEQPVDGRNRVVIERVSPEIDCGRFPIKRVVGERVVVEADVFADGHDQIACQILYWQDEKKLNTSPMKPLGNDRWRGEFSVEELGRYHYTVEGWIDRFETWRVALLKRVAARQDVHVELLLGTDLIAEAAAQAMGEDARLLRQWAIRLREAKDKPEGAAIALEEGLLELIRRYPVQHFASRYGKQLIGDGRPRKGAFLHLVRSISSILRSPGRASRNISRLRAMASLHRIHGFRCGLSSANSSNWA